MPFQGRAGSVAEVTAGPIGLLPMPVCVVSRDGRIVERNARWQGFAHRAQPHAGNDRLLDVVHPDDALHPAFGRASFEQALTVECRIRPAHGAWRWHLLSSWPLPDADGAGGVALVCAVDIDAGRRREARLAGDLRMQADMLDVSLDCIKMLDPAGRLLRMNAAGCRALGVQADRCAGVDWLPLLPAEVHGPGREALHKAQAGESARFPGCSILPGEAPQYWDNMLTPLRDAQGVVSSILCVSREVTAQRAVEERLRLAAQATNDAIRDWDLVTDRMVWNDGLQRRYGHPPEAVGTDADWWYSRIHAGDRARVRTHVDRLITGSEASTVVEYRFVCADGRQVDVCDRIRISRDRQGRAVRLVGALLDQTERKAIERSFAAGNRSLEAVVAERTAELNRLWNTSPDLLAVIGFDGVVRRISPACRAVLGVEVSEIIGHHLADLLPPEDAILSLKALADQAADNLPPHEIRHTHRDGSPRWISWVAARGSDAVYATGRNRTAEREAQAALARTEAALHHAQKMDAIGRLTSHVAHDFGNLLSVITLSAESLRIIGRSDTALQRQANAILEASERARTLISQLGDFSRRCPPVAVEFDVARNVAGLGEMLRILVGPGIELALPDAAHPCRALADPSQFDTAVVNLVANARDAIADTGRISIEVRNEPGFRTAGARNAQGAETVTLVVTDTGVGISPDAQERIFEPFYTTKPAGRGTGLGLAQVQGFARQAGGEVRVASRPGEGTRFSLVLPRAAG